MTQAPMELPDETVTRFGKGMRLPHDDKANFGKRLPNDIAKGFGMVASQSDFQMVVKQASERHLQIKR